MNLGGSIHLNKTGICFFGVILCLLLFYTIRNKNSPSSEDKFKVNLRNLLEISIKSAENGGRLVVATKDNLEVKSKGLTKEGLQDSVTTADFLSHCSMIKTISNEYATLKIISEEAKAKCEEDNILKPDSVKSNSLELGLQDEYVDEKDITVWLDPLDATKEYTEKLYQYVTTMVCIAVKGKPIIGIIHNPFTKSTTWAWVGNSKSEDLNKYSVDKQTFKVIVSRSHSGTIKEVLNKSLPNYDIVFAAGAGYKVLEVAKGEVDAYLHITAIKKWDICAGNAILEALGGKMTTKYNELIDYKDEKDVVNVHGLVATIKNHNLFLGKL